MGGIAYLSSYATPQLLKRAVQPKGYDLPENTRFVPVVDTDRKELIRLYTIAYADAPEYCDWPKAKIMTTVSQDLGACLHSDKHDPPNQPYPKP